MTNRLTLLAVAAIGLAAHVAAIAAGSFTRSCDSSPGTRMAIADSLLLAGCR